MNPGLYIPTGTTLVRFFGGSGGGCMMGRLEKGDRLPPLSKDARRDLSGDPDVELPPPQGIAAFLAICKKPTNVWL